MARDKQPLGLEHPSQGSMTLRPETMQWYLVVIFSRDFSVVILHVLVYLFVNTGLVDTLVDISLCCVEVPDSICQRQFKFVSL